MGFSQMQGPPPADAWRPSLVQAYGPPAPEGQYAWRKSVYPVRGMGQPFPNIQSQEGAGAPIFK
mgnify:CR=1 FL=1